MTPEQDEVFVFPMSYGQSQLWYLQQMDPDSSAYHIPFAFRFSGDLDIASLKFSLQEIVNRFEPLRTVFGLVDGDPKQIVRSGIELEFPVESLEELSEQDQTKAVIELAKDEAKRPFDLRTDLMVRAKLLKLGPQQHVLLIVFHHIAIDHIAVLRLKREIEVFYAAASNGQSIPSAAEELQFGDFAIWQRETMTQDFIAKKLEYWADEFRDRASILPLPTDRPRPPVQSFVGSEIYFSIPASVAEPLRQLCRENGISLFVALLSALKILFYRYTGQEDITVGCPFANRGQEECEDIVGLFMNLLPIASSVDAASSFEDLIQDVRKSVTKAHGYQDTPFEKIVQVSASDRDPAYNPMLQTWFTFQEPPMVLELQGLESESLRLHNGGAKLDLSFWLWENGKSIEGLIEYNSDLFDQDTVTRLAEHLNSIIAGIVDDPKTRIDKLPILSQAERTSILDDWVNTEATVPEKSVFEQIANHAALQPDSIAVQTDESRLTYGELITEASALAMQLNSLGIKKGALIAVCRDRTPSLVATLLGIWQHGSAYLPLDPGYPDERLKFMIKDSEAELILCEESSSERFSELSIPILGTDSVATVFGHENEPPVTEIDPASVAYVIYTSGSTGLPKGVQIPHRAMNNFLTSMSTQPGMASGDTLAAVTTISFDISVLEIFMPLVVGGKVHLISREIASDGTTLSKSIDQSGATIFQATPSTYRLLIDAGWEGNDSIRLLCGGETLPVELAADLESRCAELWNMYGPTETTVWSTIQRIDDITGEITIGKPIMNTVIRILDKSGEPTPVGIPGELYIGGLGLAEGYLKRPELNASRFNILNVNGHEERFYKTGDRVKWNKDGTIVHMGRDDRQVKLRGFRIELEEIENVIMEAANGANVAVTIWSPSAADQRLVAYIVSNHDNATSPMNLRKVLRRQLPDFMIPQHFVPLTEMPLTANGKVDRKQLPSPSAGAEAADKPPPETHSEKLLAEIWGEILGTNNISKDDNFFDIGGHSLIAMRAIATIESQTGIRISARMIVMQPLAELAKMLDDNSADGTLVTNNATQPTGLAG